MVTAYLIHANGEGELRAFEGDAAPPSIEVLHVKGFPDRPTREYYRHTGFKWVGKVSKFADVYQADPTKPERI